VWVIFSFFLVVVFLCYFFWGVGGGGVDYQVVAFHIHVSVNYGVATNSRPLETIGLLCRILSLLQGSFAKETCNFKEPANRSHPIMMIIKLWLFIYMCVDMYMCGWGRGWGEGG